VIANEEKKRLWTSVLETKRKFKRKFERKF